VPLVGEYVIDSHSEAAGRTRVTEPQSTNRKCILQICPVAFESAAAAGHIEVVQKDGWPVKSIRKAGGNLRFVVADRCDALEFGRS
jgi:hypothetical protein